MITVQTKAYGAIEVDDRQRIHFPFGILGFEELKDYVLLDAEQKPFFWLQSMELAEIAFILIDPILFRPDYEIDISDEELTAIGINPDEGDKVLLLAIVTIPEDSSKMSANLQGPLIINRKEKVGRQVIATESRWQVRHFILEELKKKQGEPSC